MGLSGGPASTPARGERGMGQLMVELRRAFGADDFVETGTFEGATAAWAADRFARVVTIEASAELHRAAVARHERLGNVRFVHADTRTGLTEVVAALPGPAVLWLDAHFSGHATYGAEDECPLLDEIAAVRAGAHDAFLFIDDARLFLAPPPRPHRRTHWPSLRAVVSALSSGERPLEPFVWWDAVIAVPARAVELVADYLQGEATAVSERSIAAGATEPPSAWRRMLGILDRRSG